MQTLKQNKLKAFLITLIFILGIFVGMYLQPKLESIKSSKATPITSTEEERKITARMESQEFITFMRTYATAQLAREKQIDLDRKAAEEGAKADKAFEEFSTKYDETLSGYVTEVKTTSKEAVKEAIRNQKI